MWRPGDTDPFGSSGVNGGCMETYRANAEYFPNQGYNGVVILEVYDISGNRICSTTQNFNCF